MVEPYADYSQNLPDWVTISTNIESFLPEWVTVQSDNLRLKFLVLGTSLIGL
jgi:hypothetical protein